MLQLEIISEQNRNVRILLYERNIKVDEKNLITKTQVVTNLLETEQSIKIEFLEEKQSEKVERKVVEMLMFYLYYDEIDMWMKQTYLNQNYIYTVINTKDIKGKIRVNYKKIYLGNLMEMNVGITTSEKVQTRYILNNSLMKKNKKQSIIPTIILNVSIYFVFLIGCIWIKDILYYIFLGFLGVLCIGSTLSKVFKILNIWKRYEQLCNDKIRWLNKE